MARGAKRCAADRAAQNARTRADRAANPERYREYDRRKRERHPEKIKQRKKEYAKKNFERLKVYYRAYADTNAIAVKAKDKRKHARNWASHMVRSAKLNDAKHHRPYNIEDYITVEYLRATLETQKSDCIYCNMKMVYGEGVNRTKERMGLTVQRMDNDIAHIRANCVLACRRCNGVSQKVPHVVMLEH